MAGSGALRQPRHYGPLRETHEADLPPERSGAEEGEQSPAAPEPSASRPARNYQALHDSEQQADARIARARQATEEMRSWTHHGGMVEHHASAHEWVRQTYEIRSKMAANQQPGAGRDGQESNREEGPGSSQLNREQNQSELQEARAAVEEARRREAAERARQQGHERGGPER